MALICRIENVDNATFKPGVGKQDQYEHDETHWNYTYTVIPLTNEGRAWLDKYYYLPI